MPTDLYYSELQGDWDSDGDNIFGEARDDDVRFDYDVVLGRYPVRTAADVTTLFNKVVAYETSAPGGDWAQSMLTTGDTLWNQYDAGTYNGLDFDHAASDAEIKAMTADASYVLPYWGDRNLDVLFDTYSSWDSDTPGDFDLTNENMLSVMADGYQFMTMLTHGSYTAWAMESGSSFTSSTISTMPDSVNAAIVSTIACSTGAFDRRDSSLSESFLRSPDTGTVVYLGCSRYGWGYASTSLGTSIRYTYQFYKEFLQNGHTMAGEAFAASKEYFAGYSQYNGSYRWVQFGLNFQGDPLVQMYRSNPTQRDPVYSQEINSGQQQFAVSGLTAGDRVVLWQGDDVYEVGQADANGEYRQTITAVEGILDITITGADAPVYMGQVNVSANQVRKQITADSTIGGQMAQGFNVRYYLGRYPDARAAVEAGDYTDAFDHYLRVGAYNGYDPSEYFDEDFYVRHNPDVASAIQSADLHSGFEHFTRSGQAERRDPTVFFDQNYYLAKNPDVASAVASGWFQSGHEHFVQHGQDEPRDFSPYFDEEYYLDQNPDVAGLKGTEWLRSGYHHFRQRGHSEARSFFSVFDETFYLAANPDVAATIDAGTYSCGYEHFLEAGQQADLDPSTAFDAGYYLAANPDVAAAVGRGAFQSGFDHYVRYGYAENRPVVPPLGDPTTLAQQEPAATEAPAGSNESFSALSSVHPVETPVIPEISGLPPLVSGAPELLVGQELPFGASVGEDFCLDEWISDEACVAIGLSDGVEATVEALAADLIAA